MALVALMIGMSGRAGNPRKPGNREGRAATVTAGGWLDGAAPPSGGPERGAAHAYSCFTSSRIRPIESAASPNSIIVFRR